ncbi:MAG: putative peptidase vanX D-ala-D-ala dipeptidase [Rickettsiaceae bacterium]|jgi:D-alanyl-D-alanine dipeptidase|nr:putative peptidase vanX D-ala-D-ala dipeptidase [Rickettsiaceae bacterium]
MKVSSNLTLEAAQKEASKWVSPTKDNIPVHSTGAAVNIRLYDEVNKAFIDMGTFGVIWGINDSVPTFSLEITNAQITNRLLLLVAATKAGLINYPYEYWHFSSGDRYAVYWTEPNSSNRNAIYGSIE